MMCESSTPCACQPRLIAGRVEQKQVVVCAGLRQLRAGSCCVGQQRQQDRWQEHQGCSSKH